MPSAGEPFSATAFSAYLKEKRCVVVGPAGYLEGKGLGEWIDSHDVVVRLNWDAPMPAGMEADYGRRCDVLFKRLLKLGKIDRIDVDEYRAAGIEWVIAVDQTTFGPNAQHFRAAIGTKIPWLFDTTTRRNLFMQMRTSPLIGIVAIHALLERPVQSVDVVGCDFYASGYHTGYGGRAYREYMQRKEGTIGKTHDALLHLAHLDRMRDDPRLQFDETLTRLVDGQAPQAWRKQTQGFTAIIPARYESSRFPGKPLAEIAGKPMIVRVCERVSQALADVVVATDDERIAETVKRAGYKAVITKDAATGTDRVCLALKQLKQSVTNIVNVQGDEPLVEPASIVKLVRAKLQNPQAVIGAIVPVTNEGELASRDVVKVAIHEGGRLAYCSRQPIAGGRWKQMGMYCFTRAELAKFYRAKREGLEALEDVEIMRFLQLRMPVQMVNIGQATQAVDRPEDIVKVEALLNGE